MLERTDCPKVQREELGSERVQQSGVKSEPVFVFMIAILAVLFANNSSEQKNMVVLALRNANHPSISADGTRISVTPKGGITEVYQVFPTRKLHTFRPGGSKSWLSGDGRRLVTNGDTGLHIWDVESGSELERIVGGIEIMVPYDRWLSDQASFSSDLQFVADVVADLKEEGEAVPAVALWDMQNRELVRLFGERMYFKEHWREVTLTPDGRFLAATRNNVEQPDRDATVVWDTESGRELLRLPFDCFWLAVSANGRRLVTNRKVSEGKERLRFTVTNKSQLRSHRELGSLPEPSYYLTEIWEIETGKRVSVTDREEDSTFTRAGSGALSPDGKLLATSSLGHIILWNADTGDLLVSLPHDGNTPPREGVRSVAFSEDGRFLVTGSTPTEVVKVWRVAEFLDNDRITRE